MTITIPADQLYQLLGTEGEHWTKKTYSKGSAMCLHGAIRHCNLQPGDPQIIEQVAALKGWGTEFNDNPDTGWADIKKVINGGINITDADLLETFGPQWEPIVALVRRAAILTTDEVRRLTTVWDAAWDDMRGASREGRGREP